MPLRIATALLALACTFCLTLPSDAAKLRVSDAEVVMIDGAPYVEFDVAWDYSWHNEQNWDAAWLFAKSGKHGFFHAPVRFAADGHRALGDDSDVRIVRSADSLGVYVYRAQPTEGYVSNDWTLRLKVIPPSGENPRRFPGPVYVHGVEMVYVPEGPFSVGDPSGPGADPVNAFYAQQADTAAAPPYRVTSSGTIPVCDGVGSLCHAADNIYGGDQSGPIPASYPNGYDAFYLMKYEVTQGQYAAFLNSLSGLHTAERENSGGRNYRWRRGTIELVGDRYVAGRPDRACNFLTWPDAAAYADWAGLRPMSELEYVKAARGPADAVANEFAWGSTTIARGDTIYSADSTVANTENGSEFILGNANYRANSRWYFGYLTSFSGGDEGYGPLRVDIFESYAHLRGVENLREESGAGYYGAQGLSGSLFERVVTATDSVGRQFVGSHGDGRLNYYGRTENADWPTYEGRGLGLRGGSPYHNPPFLRVADRHYSDYDAFYGSANMGFRAARTAPKQP